MKKVSGWICSWYYLSCTLLHTYFWNFLSFLDLHNQNPSPDHMWYFVLHFGFLSNLHTFIFWKTKFNEFMNFCFLSVYFPKKKPFAPYLCIISLFILPSLYSPCTSPQTCFGPNSVATHYPFSKLRSPNIVSLVDRSTNNQSSSIFIQFKVG